MILDPASMAALQQLKGKFGHEGGKGRRNTVQDPSSEDAWRETKDGAVKATDRGFGFLELSNGESIFISPAEMRKVFPQDRITAIIRTDSQNRKQAVPIKLINASLSTSIARIYRNPRKESEFLAAIDNPAFKEKVLAKIPNAIREQEPQDGDWVLVELSDHPLLKPDRRASVIVRELVARSDDPKVPWSVTLRRHGLPKECPPDPETIAISDGFDRADMRDIPFVTIDSPSTMDMDDAISITDKGDHWDLHVAIADPTAYIPAGSPLDQEASSRAFTCYLPGFNIPVIPHVMSEGVCSLVAGEDRPALTALIHVGKDGSLSGDEPCTFALGTVRSTAKLAYDDVSDFLESGSSENLKPGPALAAQLGIFQEFAAARAAFRSRTTVLFKDKPDFDIELDAEGKPAGIKVERRRVANKIIEECMIIANECAGLFLEKHVGRGVFNRHTGFDPDKLDMVLRILKRNEITDFTKEELSTMAGFFRLRSLCDAQSTGYLDMRLRKFSIPAEMVETPAEHFGLGLHCYATWTSPIRKYGDMINHRLIKAFITGTELPPTTDPKIMTRLNTVKKTSRFAERDVREWLYTDVLAPDVAKKTVFDAEITDISRPGIKVQLTANGAMVFIPMSTINPAKSEAYAVSQEDGRLFKDGKMLYELAMNVRVFLTNADRDTRSLTGEIVMEPESEPAAAPAEKAGE